MRTQCAYAYNGQSELHTYAGQTFIIFLISILRKQLLMAQFVQFFQMDPNKLEGSCKLCKEKYGKQVFVKYTSSSKSNLKSHFNTHHKDVDIDSKAKALESETINQHFNPQRFARREEISNAVVDMVIDLNLPITIVERPKFRKVLAVATGGRYKNIAKKNCEGAYH